MKILRYLLAVFLAVYGCSDKGPVVTGPDGGTSTTGNAFTAAFVYTDGSPVADGRVDLIPARFSPADDDTGQWETGVTDADGVYSLSVLEAGTYNVACASPDRRYKSFLAEVTVAAADTISLRDTLGPVCTVNGVVERTPSLHVAARAFVRGTGYVDTVDEEGRFRFTAMAPGEYGVEVVVDSVLWVDSLLWADTLELFPGDTVAYQAGTFTVQPLYVTDTVLVIDTVRFNLP